MADTKSLLQFFIRVSGNDKLKKLAKDIGGVQKAMKAYGNRIYNDLDKADGRWKKHFDYIDKGVQMMGGALTKFVGMSAKFASVQVGALGIAMMGVHAAFVLGNATMKAFRYIAQLAAGAFAGLTIAAATAAAAIREQQAAMFAYKGKGKNEFGSGLNQIRVEMRGLMMDADLAAVGAENLNAAFSAIAKSKGGYNQAAQGLFKGLMDFASAGQDIKTGSKAAAELVATLNDPKAGYSKITEAAKALGPEMTQALEEAKKKGIDTADELKAAILDGSLAILGGVEGQFEAFNSTLINRGKALFSQIKEMFADMGQPYLEPVKKELYEIGIIFRKAFVQIAGEVEGFAQNSFIENISVWIEKVTKFFVDLLHNYLPKVDGMFGRMGDWWNRFKDGWNSILDTLRPLIDAAKVFEKMFMEILRPVGDMIGDGFMELRDLIVDNQDEFIKFGSAIGRFIGEFGDYARSIRKIFVDALPFLTKVVDGATSLFSIFTDILGVLQKFTGGMGAFGPMGLLAMLIGGGRGMKNTKGYQMFTPNKTNKMEVTAGSVSVNGKNLRPGTAMEDRLAKRQAAARGAYSASARSSRSLASNPYGIAGVAGAPIPGITPGTPGAPTPGAASPIGGRVALQGPNFYQRMTYSPERLKSEFGLKQDQINKFVNPRDTGMLRSIRNMRQGIRERRGSLASTLLMGGKYGGREFKGFNNSASGMMAASLGLGLLSNVAGEEAQGALALGSMVGMYNPMAGLAVGLGGAALNATTPGGGALMGAGAGATIGSMIAPGVGTAVGAVIGGIVGGISGALNGDKKAKEAARNAGERAMKNLSDAALEGMSNEMRKLGAKQMTSSKIGQFFDNYRKGISETGDALNNLLASDASDDSMRAYLQELRDAGSELVKDLTDADFEAMLKKPEDAIKKMIEGNDYFTQAALEVENKYAKRMPFFAETLGMSEEAIIKLADATGTNLFDAFANTEDMVKQLASGMINSFDDMQRAAGKTMSEITAIFQKPLDIKESTLAFDENIRNLRDQINAGTAGETEILTAFANVPGQLIGAKGGDQLAAMYEMARLFDPKVGRIFSQVGGPLEGQQGYLESTIPGKLQETSDLARASVGNIGSERIVAGLLGAGLQLGEGQALVIKEAIKQGFLETGAGSKGSITQTELNDILATLDRSDFTDPTQQQAFANKIALKIGESDRITVEKFKVPLDASALKLDDSAKQLFDAANAIIRASGGTPSTATSPSQTGRSASRANSTDNSLRGNAASLDDGDTRTRRAFGDTSSNLARTLSTHSALSGQIPGRRSITSSYRNFALGSLNSDHLTGNALDIVGDNLVSYRDAVNRSGGFAEFHGGFGPGRHLHAVPSLRPFGDELPQVGSMSMAGGMPSNGAVTVNNTFNISGVDGSKEELVNTIVAKINASVRDARERS
jgi:hypothetical protein